jgi:hypothetical protein
MKPVWHHKNMYNRHKIVSTQLNNQRKIQTFLSKQIAAQRHISQIPTQKLCWLKGTIKRLILKTNFKHPKKIKRGPSASKQQNMSTHQLAYATALPNQTCKIAIGGVRGWRRAFEIHQNRSKVEIDNREKILQLLKMGSSLI